MIRGSTSNIAIETANCRSIVSPTKKLLTVVIILGLGVGLSWPFRKGELQTPERAAVDSNQQQLSVAFPKIEKVTPPAKKVAAQQVTTQIETDQKPSEVKESASIDLNSPVTPKVDPKTPPSSSRPAYATEQNYLADGDGNETTEVVHIVRNSDTLEKTGQALSWRRRTGIRDF